MIEPTEMTASVETLKGQLETLDLSDQAKACFRQFLDHFAAMQLALDELEELLQVDSSSDEAHS